MLAAGKVREGAVGFGHAVGVFFFLEGSTSFVVGIDYFRSQALVIRHTGPRTS